MEEDQANAEDVISILVATDVHLGHNESDPVRGDDSFTALEEVLTLAVEHDVDMTLLAGDLFDMAKPSQRCILRCTELMRKYSFGDKPVAIEILSDQNNNFSRVVNYEDPNINVSYPIFSIHGNHDDPVGQISITSLDILSEMGLVNYFGKWTDYSKVHISPVLIRKGCTNLALYGLGNMKEHRLARLFEECKVEMERPADDGVEWFNILTLHQNRVDRGKLQYIPERVLPEFLDLVVWGHEHDCRVIEEHNPFKNFYVTQPGSTVATSLALGESLPKHCALLQVYKKKFKLTPIPLKTVRPFVFKTIVLSEERLETSGVDENEKVKEFLTDKVHEAIEESKTLYSGHPAQPTLPLVRLNVFYEHDGQAFHTVRFGQNFINLVANPTDIINMKKEKRVTDRKLDPSEIDEEAMKRVMQEEQDMGLETLLEKYYNDQPADKRLSVLSVRAMSEAVKDLTLKNNDETFFKTFEAHRQHCVDFLMQTTAETEDEVMEQLTVCKERLDLFEGEELKKLMNAPARKPSSLSTVPSRAGQMVIESSDEEAEAEPAPPPPTRGRGRGSRGVRGVRGARGGEANAIPVKPEPRTPRSKAKQSNNSSNWMSDLLSSRPKRNTKPIVIDDSDSN